MRILFITHRFPYPPNRGDRIRAWQILRHLASFAEVDLACTADEPITLEQRSKVQDLCRRMTVAQVGLERWLYAAWSVLSGRSASEGLFRSVALGKELARWRLDGEYDVVFVYCSSMSPYLEMTSYRAEQTIVDLIDVDSQKWRDYAASKQGLLSYLYDLESRRVEKLERHVATRCSRLLVTTESEKLTAAAIAPDCEISVLKNSVEPQPQLDELVNEDDPYTQTCVFIGALDYPPNIQAATWFAISIWPGVRKEFPNARFLIVGRRPTSEIRNLAREPGIELHADVLEVQSYLAEATIAVAPLQIARGVQNKVLEAMAAGRAVIASPEALQGVDAVPDTHLICAETPDQWIAAIRRLFQDPQQRRRLGATARQFVCHNHSSAEQLRLLRSWLIQIAQQGQTRQSEFAAT